MSDVRREDFTGNLFTFLVETFEGPPESASAYLDQKAGLFDTLEHLSAAQASQPIAEGAISIAAHVEHIRFYLNVVEQFMSGRTEKVNWEDSWCVQKVTPETWSALKQDLKAAYTSVTKTFESIGKWEDDEVGDSLTIVVHTAYHLGAIRQVVKVIV